MVKASAVKRAALQLDWEKRLYRIMVEIEHANGEGSDDMEALIRLAWREVYRDNAKRKDSSDAL